MVDRNLPIYGYLELSEELSSSIGTDKFDHVYREELSKPVFYKGYYLNITESDFKDLISNLLTSFDIEVNYNNIHKAIKSLQNI